MSDFIAWLLEQVAEDERRANLIPIHGQRWKADESRCCVDSVDDNYHDPIAQMTWQHAEHIATWDPARVLAEREAKRRIIDWHKQWPVLVETRPELELVGDDLSGVTLRMTKQIAWLTEQKYREAFGVEPPTGPILRLLALPYADRPGYREEWRPA